MDQDKAWKTRQAAGALQRKRYAKDPEYRARQQASNEKSRVKSRLKGVKYHQTLYPPGVTHPKDLPVLKNGFVKWWK